MEKYIKMLEEGKIKISFIKEHNIRDEYHKNSDFYAMTTIEKNSNHESKLNHAPFLLEIEYYNGVNFEQN